MSKKSRRRNKKILGALAAGLGAMALMRGKGTPAAANVDSGRAGDSSSALARVKANTPVTGTEYPGANKAVVAPVSTSKNLSRMHGHGPNSGVVGQGTRADYVLRNRNAKLSAMNKVPPSMRGGADAAQGYLRKIPSWGQYPGGWTDKPGGWSSQGLKKGGRVKLAKRGFGRALMKGKK